MLVKCIYSGAISLYLCLMAQTKTSLHQYFESFPDHRVNRNKKHLLSDIIMLSVIGVLCGAESWDSIEAFGKTKLDFLKGFLKLPNGIPSHDTINRVFSGLRPKLFEKMFVQWVDGLKDGSINKEVISIDGKSIRGSRDSFHAQNPIHMVSAWASNNELVLGQLKVADKSNEITAIPLLLELLDIGGSIVTIDAMGTQVEIAKKIIENGADYILSVKGNQRELLEQISERFGKQAPADTDTTNEKGHGRIESRKCEVITDLAFIDNGVMWAGIKSVVRITSTRELANRTTTEMRYYISSLDEPASHFNTYIRQHWGVENKLHWSLDMIFNEDRQRKRTKNAADNFSYIRKIGLNLLKKDTSKGSLVTKRLKAGWDNKYLMQIFNQI